MAPLYYLSLEVSGALVTASVNGLPVYRSESPYGAAHSGPVNDLLVGEGNRLTVRLAPSDSAAYAEAVAEGMDPLDGVRLTGALVRYPPDTDYVPSDATAGDTLVVLDLAQAVEEIRAERSQALAQAVEAAPASARAALVAEAERSGSLAGALPLEIEAVFDAEDAASFRATLVESAPVDDREAVLDYAERLRDLFAAADGSALWTEYAKRNREYSEAYPTGVPTQSEFIAFIEDDLATEGLTEHMSFPRSAISAEPRNDGRQWELRVWRNPDGTPAPGGPSEVYPEAQLTPFVAAEREYKMNVTVGIWDGRIRVVR